MHLFTGTYKVFCQSPFQSWASEGDKSSWWAWFQSTGSFISQHWYCYTTQNTVWYVSVQPSVSKYETSLEDAPAVLFTAQGWPHKKISEPRTGNCHDNTICSDTSPFLRFANFIIGHIILDPLVSNLYNAICSLIFSTKLMHFSNVSYTGLDIKASLWGGSEVDRRLLDDCIKCLAYDDRQYRPECYGRRIMLGPNLCVSSIPSFTILYTTYAHRL